MAEQIRQRLAALEPLRIELEDQSERHRGHAGWQPEGGTHWRLVVVSARFAGRSRLERHRMVYEALRDLMRKPIHALELEARAPGEPGA